MIGLWLMLGLAIGVVIGYLLLKSSMLKDNLPKDEIEKRYVLKELYTESAERLRKKEQELTEAAKTIRELDIQLASIKKEEEGLNEKLALFKEEIESLHTRSHEQFKNLANEIMEEKSKKFTEQNQHNINEIMNPLRERIKDFQDKVEKSYSTEAAERNTLKGEIKKLVELNHKISKMPTTLPWRLKATARNKATGAK